MAEALQSSFGNNPQEDSMPQEDRGGAEAALQACRLRVVADAQDWRAALLLKASLAAQDRYAEADPAFRAARAAFPDDVWLAHMATLHAYPQAELAALTSRAAALAAEAPEDGARARLLGNLLLQARDYAAASAAFLHAPDPDSALRRRSALGYAALAGTLAEAQATGPAPALAIVNLDRNPGRLAETEAHFAGCRMPRFRVPAIEGARLPDAAARRLGGDPARRGTLGCFLSHAAAWEAMLARGLSHCLVVEDDTMPLLDLPRHWGVFGLPEQVDLCFVNDRMAPRAAVPAFQVITVAEALHQFPSERNAAGADGYLISAAGARKLLGWLAEDGFAEDVDWRLVAYAISPAERATLPAGSHALRQVARLHDMVGCLKRLDARVLSPPLVRTVPIASDREDEDRRGRLGNDEGLRLSHPALSH